MKNLVIFLVLIIMVISCEKPPDTAIPDITTVARNGGVFILNEGSFNNGNATLSYYDFSSQKLNDDIFYNANNFHLGDVLQSMTVYNGNAYLVVNNSGKVEIIDATTFKSKGTIKGLHSPRYFQIVNSNKAYVSDLYDNNIAVVDLVSLSVTSKIACPGATEQMLLWNNKVFVCNTKKYSAYVIDVVTDHIVDSIHLSYGSNSIVQDKNKKIWILCSGDSTLHQYGGLYRINPLNDSVEFYINDIYPLGIFGSMKLVMNGEGDRLYWLNRDVQSIGINETTLSSLPFIFALNKTFYGIEVDSVTGEIYVSDAINFVQSSTVYRYNTSGYVTGAFKSGINTNGFKFINR